MSNDLGKKVQQIAQMLNQEDMPDNMKELVALLTSSLAKGNESSSDSSVNKADKGADKGDASHQEHRVEGGIGGDSSHQEYRKDGFEQKTPQDTIENKSSDPESTVNPEIINTALQAMNRISSANDPRINLLHAIEPFMNTRRQRKIGNCIQLLQLAGLSRLLNDREK